MAGDLDGGSIERVPGGIGDGSTAVSELGARSMILPTVTVERFAVVGAQSVVTRDVPASTIVAGNPARTLAERKQVPHD